MVVCAGWSSSRITYRRIDFSQKEMESEEERDHQEKKKITVLENYRPFANNGTPLTALNPRLRVLPVEVGSASLLRKVYFDNRFCISVSNTKEFPSMTLISLKMTSSNFGV